MNTLIFDEDNIQVDLEIEYQYEALTYMANNLYERNLVKESFKQAIISREKEFPTGLPTRPYAVAIPHTDPEHIIKKNISLAVMKEPVNFSVMGDPDTKIPIKL